MTELAEFDLATLDTLLRSVGVNPTATDIDNYLITRGVTDGVADFKHLFLVLPGTPPFLPVSEPAIGLITPAGTYSLNTDQTPLIPVFVLDDQSEPPNQNLIVTGHNDILIATGNGTNTIALHDHGNDIVEAGSGSNTISGGFGADSIYSAGSSDLLTAGSGAHSLLYDSGDNATLRGGTGGFDTLIAGSGSTDSLVAGHGDAFLEAGRGTGDTLSAGAFADVTLHGGVGTGDVLLAYGADDVLLTGHSKHEYLYAGGSGDTLSAGGADGSGDGSGTLVAGGGNEQFHIGAHGSDTISGSSGGNTVYFDDQAYGSGTDVSITTARDGVTTITFADTDRHFKISGVQTLTFSDGHIVHP